MAHHSSECPGYSLLPASGVVSGPLAVHTCNRATLEFASTKQRPTFLGGPVCFFGRSQSLITHLHVPK